MRVVTPSDDLESLDPDTLKIFLAGGMKNPWRKALRDKLQKANLTNLIIIDPTIDDWASIGKNDISNPDYVRQTDWEHMGLIKADIEVFHFDSSSVSPITLIEMGMYKSQESIICVESGYRKKAYIEYMGDRYGMPVTRTINELANLLAIRCHNH